jgi:hypothetical protein
MFTFSIFQLRNAAQQFLAAECLYFLSYQKLLISKNLAAKVLQVSTIRQFLKLGQMQPFEVSQYTYRSESISAAIRNTHMTRWKGE